MDKEMGGMGVRSDCSTLVWKTRKEDQEEEAKETTSSEMDGIFKLKE